MYGFGFRVSGRRENQMERQMESEVVETGIFGGIYRDV